MRTLVVALGCLISLACASREHRPVARPMPPPPPPRASASFWQLPTLPSLPSLPTCAPGLWWLPGCATPGAALASAHEIVPLYVPGFGNAMVSLPIGATGRRPVMVAAHGAYDRPEWMCEDMRNLVGNRGFVLCPQGIPAPLRNPKDETRYLHGAELAEEIDAAVIQLRGVYAHWVDTGPMLYSGFSLGASRGASIVMPDPARFPRALLIEGGQSGWNERNFAEKGGQRVLFACGLPGCVGSSVPVVERFVRAGVPSKVAYGAGGGHGRGGVVADAIHADWSWFVEGDARWAP
jgi:hypothetical protein